MRLHGEHGWKSTSRIKDELRWLNTNEDDSLLDVVGYLMTLCDRIEQLERQVAELSSPSQEAQQKKAEVVG